MTDSDSAVKDPVRSGRRGSVSVRSQKPAADVPDDGHRCGAARLHVLADLSSGQIRAAGV